jgi:ferredoxin-NADP reductase
MEQALRIGSEVWVKLPYGNFVIDGSADAVLVAGGTGISAFTAFLEALQPQNARRVKLVYGARASTLFLFKDMILSQLARVPNLDVVFFTETADAAFAKDMAALPRPAACFNGRIAVETLWPHLAEPLRQTYYLSGPPVMLKTLGADLKSRGVEPDRIRTDAWE